MPGLAELASNLDTLANEGIHGGVDLGPVHLEVGSSVLVIAPPTVHRRRARSRWSSVRSASARSPRRCSRRSAAAAACRAADRSCGCPANGGYGGTLELPLGPVQISATAVLAVIDGEPSFLAIMGVEFLPPIQLSFGFSLDRVGGIVGVNRRADTEALRAALRTGAAGDVLFAIRPPATPLALVTAAEPLVPLQPRHAPRRPVAEAVVAVVRSRGQPDRPRPRRDRRDPRPARS